MITSSIPLESRCSMNHIIRQSLRVLSLILGLSLLLPSCRKFVFGDVSVAEQDNPLINKKTPRTSADLFKAPVVREANLPNPDAGGAFDDWATCLIMLKEGHPHGGGKLHGNYVYDKAPWRQEEFVVVHNKPEGIQVEVDRKSVATYLEVKAGKEGPNYLRIVGGNSKLWGFCLYFFDKKGELINDKILAQSAQYQIFFSISDVDDKGKPYEVLDVRYNADGTESIPAKYFADKSSFEQRSAASPEFFRYTYRDTWYHEDMSDGVRELFNLKLLPPLTRDDLYKAYAPADQDYVGLKGHLMFDFFETAIDWREEWPIKRTDGRPYTRGTSLLPQFYMAVRVMKCDPGKKAVIPVEKGDGLSKYRCAPFYEPNKESGWKEVIRFNVPMKVYTTTFDSDPTQPDPNEPYYYNIGREIGLTAAEAFEAVHNIQIHGGGGAGGQGFGSWFL